MKERGAVVTASRDAHSATDVRQLLSLAAREACSVRPLP